MASAPVLLPSTFPAMEPIRNIHLELFVDFLTVRGITGDDLDRHVKVALRQQQAAAVEGACAESACLGDAHDAAANDDLGTRLRADEPGAVRRVAEAAAELRNQGPVAQLRTILEGRCLAEGTEIVAAIGASRRPTATTAAPAATASI